MKKEYFFLSLLCLFLFACQKELSFETNGNTPVPPPPPPPTLPTGPEVFKGWTTTYYLKGGDSLKTNSTVKIDSTTHQIFFYDSIVNKIGAKVSFTDNWKIKAIYYYEQGNLVQVDSFHRAANGGIIYYLVNDGNGQLKFAYQLLEEDLTDSIRLRVKTIVPLDPSLVEGDDYYIIQKNSQQVSYIFHYSKRNLGGQTDSLVVKSRFTYSATKAIEKSIHVQDEVITGSGAQTKHTEAVYSYLNYADQGKFEIMKQLDQMIFGNELGWYRHSSELLTPFFGETGWRNLTGMPSAENLIIKTYLNGSLNEQNTVDFLNTYSKNAKGDLLEIKQTRTTAASTPNDLVAKRTHFIFAR